MSDKPKPVADAIALVGDGDDTQWIEVGPVFKNKDGSLFVEMRVEPIAWQSPRCRRRMQIRFRTDRNRGGDDGTE